MRAEDRFSEFYTVVRKSTTKEDISEHWDVLAIIDGQEKKVDVKSRSSHPHGVYIELLNVAGKPGWLFGDADYIAFEHEDGFFLLDRYKLIELVSCIEPSFGKVLCGLHRRPGRNDLTTVIPWEQIVKNRLT